MPFVKWRQPNAYPYSSVEETRDHDTKLLATVAEKFNLTVNAFGTKISKETDGAPSSGSLVLSEAFDRALAPAPVTPTDTHSAPWNVLSGTIKATYNSHRALTGKDEIIVSPGMGGGNTGKILGYSLIV